MEFTLEELIEAHVEVLSSEFLIDERSLSSEEKAIFAIDPARWPRMCVAWMFFEWLLGNFDEGQQEYIAEIQPALDAVKAAHPEWAKLSEGRHFRFFAKEYAGMTYRESFSAFGKMVYYNHRNGKTYPDEKPD